MAEVEDTCAELTIPLIVLPPIMKIWSGVNRTFREESYNRNALLADSIGTMRAKFKNPLTKYNTYGLIGS